MDFETFWGPWGVSQQEKFAKSGFKASTINMIKKSLTFAPFKITLKIIFGRFPLAFRDPHATNSVQIQQKFIYL